MAKIYDRNDRYIGYSRDNRIYNRKNEMLGYMDNNVVYDINSSPVFYFYDDKFYWMNGMPWAYFNGRTIRDFNDNYIGNASNTLSSILAAGLLYSNKMLQAQYNNTKRAANTESKSRYIAQNNGIDINGLGGMVQNVMNIGRSMFRGARNTSSPNPPAGGIGPYVSVWGKYLLSNPQLTMSILSRFIKL